MRITPTLLFFLFVTPVVVSGVRDRLDELFGIDCFSNNNNLEDLVACANESLRAWLDEMSDMLNIDCMRAAGTDMDQLMECAEETAVELMAELGEITNVDCLKVDSTMMNVDLEALETCASEALGDVVDCFDTPTDDTTEDIIKCASGTMNDVFGVMEEVPSCVETSLAAMADCATANAEACAETCNDVSVSPLEELSYSEMSCSSLHAGIMTPVCQVTSCCAPCVSAMEAVAMCMANEVLVLKEDAACDMTCSSSTRRGLGSYPQEKRHVIKRAVVEEPKEPAIVRCGAEMAGERRTLETVKRLMDCSLSEYLDTIEQNAPEVLVTSAPAPVDNTANTPPVNDESSRASGGRALPALLAAALVMAATILV